jgi:hypothetical protein
MKIQDPLGRDASLLVPATQNPRRPRLSLGLMDRLLSWSFERTTFGP